MASLTGLAFQIDFIVGKGSRQNTVNSIRDTVDQINLISRQGATKASQERRTKLEQDLAALDKLSKKSAKRSAKKSAKKITLSAFAAAICTIA